MVRQMSQPPPISAKPEQMKSSSDAATMRGVQLKVLSGGETASGSVVASGAEAGPALSDTPTAGSGSASSGSPGTRVASSSVRVRYSLLIAVRVDVTSSLTTHT